MKFVCKTHPELQISDLGVRFRDGVAEVDDETAAKLRKLPDELGVREAGDDDAEDAAGDDEVAKEKPPAKSTRGKS